MVLQGVYFKEYLYLPLKSSMLCIKKDLII